MSRREGEITGHMKERGLPHLVELELRPGGFRDRSFEFNAFHHERGIPIRCCRGRHEVEQFYVRFCFPDAAIADAFQGRFGGMRLTYSPSKSGQRPSGPRLRYQRSYLPRSTGRRPTRVRLMCARAGVGREPGRGLPQQLSGAFAPIGNPFLRFRGFQNSFGSDQVLSFHLQ